MLVSLPSLSVIKAQEEKAKLLKGSVLLHNLLFSIQQGAEQ